jgi:CheY-like chemotaxis protein
MANKALHRKNLPSLRYGNFSGELRRWAIKGGKMTDFAKILEGISALLWPCILILLVFLFKPAVAALIESAKSRKFSLKIGGQELTMEEANAQQRTLIADLQTQVLEIQKKIGGIDQPKATPLTVKTRDKGQRTLILWVDDQPKNNSYFVQQLSDMGFSIDLALSTSEGLRRFDREKYSIIISDMGRIEEGLYKATAGLELLKDIRVQSLDIPFIIFCSSRKTREHSSEAKALGVTSITSSPTELMGIIQNEFVKIAAQPGH